MPKKSHATPLTKSQKSLLLYLETCAVDLHGRVNLAHMNTADTAQTESWHKSYFISWRRILSAHIIGRSTIAVTLSDRAWTPAAAARRARANANPIPNDHLTEPLPRTPDTLCP